MNKKVWEENFTNKNIRDISFSKKIFRKIFNYNSLRFTIFCMKTKNEYELGNFLINDYSPFTKIIENIGM